MVGSPGETDEDVRETLDLVYEIERRGLFGFLMAMVRWLSTCCSTPGVSITELNRSSSASRLGK